MSRLNYSKWDNLELSDDSDVEVHPNVDKKSFIRWKQRDIHEKREQRKMQLAGLRAERETNGTLGPMIDEIINSTKSEGHTFYSREVSRLTADRASRGNQDGPNGPTPNDMILSLLLQINEDPTVKGKQGAELDEALAAQLRGHRVKLDERTKQIEAEIKTMEEEDKRKITSDGLRDGFNTGYVAKREEEEKEEEEAKIKEKASKGKPKSTSSTTTYETINAPGPSASTAGPSSTTPDSDAEESDDESTPDLTPAMKGFALLPSCIPASIPLSAEALPATFTPKALSGQPFSAALDFLSTHKALLRSNNQANATDAMLVEAFQSQMRGEKKRARQFVEKGLMLQYLGKLGPDGVNLFFRRMAGQDGKAVSVFFNDVLSTYVRISKRCEAIQAEEASKPAGDAASGGAGQEQIQLVAEDPSTVIGFDVPEGPAPDHIELEGEAAEQLGVEQVRAYLDKRWELFQAFPEEMKEALKTKELEKVNDVLGKMQVDVAEELVGKLDEAGILSFSSNEVRDETGK